MNVDIKQFTEKMLQSTRSFVESGQDVQPTCFLLPADGKLTIVGFGNFAPETKQAIATWMTSEAKRLNAIVVFVADTWARSIKGKQMSGKQEALVVSVFGPGMKALTAMQHYSRDASGKIEWQVLEWNAEVSGTFAPDLSGDTKTN